MEIYILDTQLRRNHVVDKFESMIWTERWQSIGDFELSLKSTLENRTLFIIGTHLAINNSYRVMTIETVEDSVDEDGKGLLHISGRSLEAILEDRVSRHAMTDTLIEPNWVFSGTPGDIIREKFDEICRPPGVLSADDEIPFIMPGSIFPASNIPEYASSIDWVQEPDSLYNAIHEVAKIYDLGFRLVRNFDESELYFDVYTGNDRTTKQSVLDPVVFSVDLNNIQNTTEFMSVSKSKNVAYVFSDLGYEVVFAEGVDPTISGFERRVLVVTTTSETGSPAEITAGLVRAGMEALQQNRKNRLFDGEVNQRDTYTYGVDYDLGDLVEMRNRDGVITYKRITEQIFVSDTNGERSYPTLAMDMYDDYLTSLSYVNSDTVWADMTTEVWADL